ncbi:MAG: glycosyltransferase [Acidobacteriota bacterium]
MSKVVALNACTIVSKNYICYARVLCRSFLEHHPQGRFFVVLVDRNDGHIDPGAEEFTLLEAEDLDNIPDLQGFLFKYTLLECNTAVKPYVLEHLAETHGLDNIVYFDPDILITGSLDPLHELLQQHSVVLTPHLTAPIDDNAYPGEQAILQSGTYNLGFVALRTDATGRTLMRWWQDRLFDKCVVRIADGLFVDQKWMDLTPGLYDDVYILRHPGYNTAYWNLHGRTVEVTPEGPTANGEPLVFFHFSGIRPESLDGVSKHQDRFTLKDIGGAAELYKDYARRVIDAGYFDCRGWPYAFRAFSNGVVIPDSARAYYLEMERKQQQRFAEPFDADATPSFYDHLQEPAGRRPDGLSRFLEHLHRSRPDLSSAFRDPAGADFAAYRGWLFDVGRHQLKLDAAFLAALPKESPADVIQPGGVKRKAKNALKRLYHSAPGRLAKGLFKGVVGAERAKAIRRRLRPQPAAEASGRLEGSRQVVIESPGVNVVGYLDAETGMGEAGRGMVRALEAAAVPTTLHTLGLGVVARREDGEHAGAESDFEHDINLFVLNADQVLPVRDHLGPDVFAGRYNIGLWLWELEDFPAHLEAAFEPLDEIWTPSTFCLDALARVSPIPVRRIPLPISRRPLDPLDRGHFDLTEDAFVALFVFNYLSYAERKNPVAAVRAFRQAFGDDPGRQLVLKTSQKDFAPDAHRALLAAVDGAPNIRLVDDYLSRREIDSLMAAADVYLSLHRSEGYGLTVAESMLRGTPVVATPYSGVTDFFDSTTGWPTAYELLTLERAAGPYPAGSRWAEPDVEHAAELLRAVAAGGDDVARRVDRARRHVEDELSVSAVGARIRATLDVIVRRHKPIPAAGMGR